MTNKARVYFGLRGDFDPPELTDAIGIKPTRVAKAGERIPDKIPKCSHWDYSTEEVSGDILDVDEMSSQIIRDLVPYTENIVKAIKKWDLTSWLEVVLWVSTDENISTPMVGFEPDVIQFLHVVGATIDIDMYRS